MKRVVITGMGIVSPIGNTLDEVTDSLRHSKSGITASEDFKEYGFKSQVWGKPNLDVTEVLDKKTRRFMGEGAAWNYIAMQQAIAQAGFEEDGLSDPRIGIIMGSGGPSTETIVNAANLTDKNKSPRRIGPTAVPKAMGSTASATLATAFKIKGVNYSITSACATSLHCVGAAYEQIQLGKQDVVFAGGCEDLSWTLSCLFDAMGAMSSKHNDTPATASRAYDVTRDGFVIAGGAGVCVVEDYDHAVARGANILAEITGYAANSDGADMVAPSGEGAVRCMRQALETVDTKIDYVNTHGTSTPVGDSKETGALREVFGDDIPPFSSTKSLTGHSLGGTGVQELIYSILMMNGGFIAGSAHITEIDPEFADLPIVQQTRDAELNTVLTNSFGFGGTNGVMVVSKAR